MSQSPGAKSSQSSSELKPALKGVLGCLDVQLEQELTRYRRIRRRTKSSKPETSKSTQEFHKAPEAVTLSGLESNGNGSATATGSSGKRTGWESVVIPESAPLVVASKTTQSGQNPNSTVNGAVPSSQSDSETYLESSERLLKTLDESKAASRPKRSLVGSLFTPLGITSMLVLLLSCMGLGYVVFSPTRVSLGLDRFWKITPSTAKAPNATTESEEATIAVEPESPNLARQEFIELNLNNLSNINPNSNPLPTIDAQTAVPPSPNLNTPVAPTSDPNLGGPGLNNLNRELLPQATTPPVVAPTPAPVAAPIPSPVPIPGGGSSPQTPTQSRTPTPTPTPTLTQPTAKEPVKAEDGFYYVVVDYGDERTLEKAREVVADAYVREFKTGVKIQLGALSDATSAKRLVEELRVQGITGQFDLPKPETSQG